MIEDLEGIANLRDMLKNVPGIGALLIGEGDLSQELGYPRQYEHPVVLDHMRQIREIAKEFNVPVGHPHVDSKNIARVVEEGYRFIMPAPERTYKALETGLELTGRK
jgi:4-hydroxy-2-oxoheptanedioate aldolase